MSPLDVMLSEGSDLTTLVRGEARNRRRDAGVDEAPAYSRGELAIAAKELRVAFENDLGAVRQWIAELAAEDRATGDGSLTVTRAAEAAGLSRPTMTTLVKAAQVAARHRASS